ncbi:hypothetical protein DFJ63DRAFT_315347 [Scheffersomyces coipomensis]|uniref:uncharacterized protein n=1 Tax=Scheffersomyces coipomensis TaxID=1788519 RepID=UPI00315D8CE0
MSHITLTPSTPPRSNAKSSRTMSTPLSSTTPIQQRNGLITPSTTSKSKNPFLSTSSNTVNANTTFSTTPTTFKTPSSISKKKSNNLTIPKSSVKLLPITPEFTPHKSPNSRKRKIMGNLSDFFTSNSNVESNRKEKLSFGLLLPAPSKVGSGRQYARNMSHKDNIFLSSGGYGNEVEEEEADETMIYREEEEEEEDMNIPQTPGIQLINDSLVNHWHGKSYNNYYSSDEEDNEELPTPTKLENPFLSTTNSTPVHKSTMSSNPFDDNSKSVNYDTHMELVNNKTGQRRIVKLTANQSRIKPKKLDFSGI